MATESLLAIFNTNDLPTLIRNNCRDHAPFVTTLIATLREEIEANNGAALEIEKNSIDMSDLNKLPPVPNDDLAADPHHLESIISFLVTAGRYYSARTIWQNPIDETALKTMTAINNAYDALSNTMATKAKEFLRGPLNEIRQG